MATCGARMPAADPYPLSHVYPIGSRINDRGHLEIGGCDAVELAAEFGRRPSSSPRTICAPARVPTRRARGAQPRRSTCCSPRRRSRAPLSTACSPRRDSRVTSPPAASWRWRYAAASIPRASTCTATPSPGPSSSSRSRPGSGISCWTRCTTSNAWSRSRPSAVRRQDVLISDHPRCRGRHARCDLDRPGRLEVRLLASRTRPRAIDRVAASPHLRLVGLHCHIGSQLLELEPFVRAIAALVDARRLRRLQPGRRARRGVRRDARAAVDRGLRRDARERRARRARALASAC